LQDVIRKGFLEEGLWYLMDKDTPSITAGDYLKWSNRDVLIWVREIHSKGYYTNSDKHYLTALRDVYIEKYSR